MRTKSLLMIAFVFTIASARNSFCQKTILENIFKEPSDYQKVIFQMSSHYIPLITASTDVKYKGSGLIVSSDSILTVFHLLKPYGDTKLVDGTRPDLIFSRPYQDLALLKFSKPIFMNIPRLKAGIVQQGDKVYCYSNAQGLDGVYQEYVVGKVTEQIIFLSPRLDEGASGAAVYNKDGDVVGLVSRDVGENNSMGAIIPASMFKGIFEQNSCPPAK